MAGDEKTADSQAIPTDDLREQEPLETHPQSTPIGGSATEEKDTPPLHPEPAHIRFWTIRKVRIIAFLLVLAATWLLLKALDTPWAKGKVQELFSEGIEHTTAFSARKELENVAWADTIPKAIWIDFDEDTVRRPLDNGQSPEPALATSRKDIAVLLDWIRSAKVHPAKMVFLDVAIPYPAPEPEQKALHKALEDWSRDPVAPPLVILAGASCSLKSFASEPAHYFKPSLYQDVVTPSPDGRDNPKSKIIWSCPLFDGLSQDFWHCVVPAPEVGGPPFALPSPAWASNVISQEGTAFGPLLQAGLAQADAICRRTEGARLRLEPGSTVPLKSPVKPSFNPLDVSDSGSFRHSSAGEILRAPRDYATSTIEQKIVVIGASNTSGGSRDVIATPLGPAPGPAIVAEAIRAAWGRKSPQETPWWAGAIMASALVSLAAATLVASRWARAKLASQEGVIGKIGLILTNAHLIAALFLPLSLTIIFFAGAGLTGLDFVRVGSVLVILEAMFIVDSIFEGWEHDDE